MINTLSPEIKKHLNDINNYLEVFHFGYSVIYEKGLFWFVVKMLSGEKIYVSYNINNPDISNEVHKCMLAMN